jgi:hypothetical protein
MSHLKHYMSEEVFGIKTRGRADGSERTKTGLRSRKRVNVIRSVQSVQCWFTLAYTSSEKHQSTQSDFANWTNSLRYLANC